MIITSAAVTVLMIYFLLCAENYHWQWRSFFTAGASAFYVFASCLLYWVKDVSFSTLTSGVVYLGYSALLSLLVFVLTGKFTSCHCWGEIHTDIFQVPLASLPAGCLPSGSTGPSRSTKPDLETTLRISKSRMSVAKPEEAGMDSWILLLGVIVFP
jgi:hypothetical protein